MTGRKKPSDERRSEVGKQINLISMNFHNCLKNMYRVLLLEESATLNGLRVYCDKARAAVTIETTGFSDALKTELIRSIQTTKDESADFSIAEHGDRTVFSIVIKRKDKQK
jgi:hypothetical protein